MKKLKYLIVLVLSMTMLNSCFDDTTERDLNGEGLNVVTLERVATNLTCEANGSEYDFDVRIKIVGPTIMDLTSDLTVSFTARDSSTAVDGVHYRLNNSPLTLSADNNYLGILSITLISVGNTPPLEGTPEFDDYVAPKLWMDIAVTGDATVAGSGKGADFTLNFTAPNPYAGIYNTVMRYFHPTAGGSHPTFDPFDPDDPYGGVRTPDKELIAVTGRKCETTFGVWGDLCWITVNPDNSIKYEVDDTWTYDVQTGDPTDPAHIPYFDPADGTIYMYYYYNGSGGDRIFWEVFTPTF